MKQTLIVIILSCLSSVYAQGLFESSSTDEKEENKTGIELNGYTRGSVYGGASDYDYSSIFGEFSLQGKVNQKNTFLFTDLRFRNGINFEDEYTLLQIKEAYAGYTGEKFDALLGNQIVTWGRTDGFNPTNNITPNNYFFLTADPDDQKLSNFMLRMKYRVNPKIDIDVIGIPIYSSSVFRYDLFDLGDNAYFGNSTNPEKSFKNGSVAARLNFELSKLGFSLSYFRGYDPYYGFNVESIDWSTGTPEITNSPTPYFKNTIGADLAVPLGSWIARSEFAYNITNDYVNEMYIPNPDLAYVVGIERNFSGFNTIIQYIGKYTLDFTKLEAPELLNPADPLAQLQYANELIYYESSSFNQRTFHQQEETNHAVSLTISKSLAYEAWNAEFTTYYNITSEEYLIRPKLSWKISDALTTSAGYSYMNGPEYAPYNYSGAILNGGFFELKVNF